MGGHTSSHSRTHSRLAAFRWFLEALLPHVQNLYVEVSPHHPCCNLNTHHYRICAGAWHMWVWFLFSYQLHVWCSFLCALIAMVIPFNHKLNLCYNRCLVFWSRSASIRDCWTSIQASWARIWYCCYLFCSREHRYEQDCESLQIWYFFLIWSISTKFDKVILPKSQFEYGCAIVYPLFLEVKMYVSVLG